MALKIMVVDDEADLEPLILQKFRKKLKEDEYQFIFAHNGLDALTKLLEHPDIALILTDINMPEMDGLTLLSRLKELKNPLLKTIVVSAYGDMDNIRTAMNRGAFDFVTKPIDFNDLEATLAKTIEEWHHIVSSIKEHEQLVSIRQDLDVARDIQQAILPRDFPSSGAVDLFGSMSPAKEVGGDFYDFFWIDDERLGLVIGDVSGKGISAAIFMAVTRTILRATGLKGMPTSECLASVNHMLSIDNSHMMFVTVFYAILNIKTGELTYTNAGHNAPIIIDAKGNISQLELNHGLPLGISKNDYTAATIKLEPGSGVFMYTDGITESFNSKGEAFGEERMLESLKGANGKNAMAIAETIATSVKQFIGNAEQSDDSTLMVACYNGGGSTHGK